MRAALIAMIVVWAGVARADNLTVGLFAPTVPIGSTAARVDLASKLGEALGKAMGGTGTGRAYARAGDFAAAVKKGDITVAVVDATYLAAAGGGYTVIAAATHGGEAAESWQLVAKAGGATKIADLKGKHVLVPAIGGRETDFVLNVLLGGEVARDYFGKIDQAPDSVSAIAALNLGKADAVVVPGGVDLQGATKLLALPSLSGPVLVAYGTTTPAQRTALANAAVGFHGDGAIGGFTAGGDEGVRGIARRFSVAVKRGPLVVPAVRLLVGDLVEGRTFAIERAPATNYIAK